MNNDLISRQAALDALEWKWAGKAAMDAIKNLPSAQPEPKKGKWIKGQDVPNRKPYYHLKDALYCSVCYEEAYWDSDYGQQLFAYCPHCGAEMEVKE